MQKVFLLKAYIAIHRFDIICISETYPDSSTSPDNNLDNNDNDNNPVIT